MRLGQNRRNLTQAGILTCVRELDKLRTRGGDRRSAEAISKASREAFEKSASKTAQRVGISRATVERARTVLSDDEATLADMTCFYRKSEGGD